LVVDKDADEFKTCGSGAFNPQEKYVINIKEKITIIMNLNDLFIPAIIFDFAIFDCPNILISVLSINKTR
tara:strand:- start:21 stop:230 length:210 start_codon:yes stop_codon:yes gene_type:complete